MPKNEKPRIIDQQRTSAGGYTFVSGNGGGGGVTDHGMLTGLADDDHTQYHNDARGDARYVPLTRQVTGTGGLTGGGALSGDLSLSLAAGVAGTGLALAAGVLSVNVTDGLTTSGDNIILASSAAGAGLGYSGGVLSVGAGDGLTVGADSVALTTPGTLSVSSTNAASGSHTHAITSSSNPGAAARLLATDSSGVLQLATVKVGSAAVTINSTDNVGTNPDIQFGTNGLIAAETSLYLAIDSNNDSTSAALIIGNNAATSGFTELARLTETGRLGIGNNAPSYELDVTGTARATVALRTDTAYVTTKVQTPLLDTATGNMSIMPDGDLVLDPGGSDVLPGGSVEDDLGDYNRKWRTLFASELYVETLVAQDVLSTIGGRIEVTPTTTLIADMGSGDTTMDVKHNNLRNGEYAYLMTAPAGLARFEAIKVTSASSAITGGYRYSITRNLDGSGPNTFYVGDAVASLGKNAGEGHISLTATSTVYNHLGPTIAIYTRNSTATWNALTPTTALGNLESFVGYGTATQGFAVGNDLTLEPTTGFKGLTADATNGLRLFSTDITMYNGSTPTGYWAANGGTFWLGPSSADKRLSWDGSTFAITGTVTASAGAIANWLIGTVDANTISNTNNTIRLIAGGTGTSRVEVGNTATADTGGGVVSRSTSSGIVFWAGKPYTSISSAPFRVTNGGSLTATDATITGAVTAGGGNVWMNSAGLGLDATTGKFTAATASWWYSTNRVFSIGTTSDLSVPTSAFIEAANGYPLTITAPTGITVVSATTFDSNVLVHGTLKVGAGAGVDVSLSGHTHDYAATSHTHATYSLTSHTHDYSSTYAALSHTHATYAALAGATFSGSVTFNNTVVLSSAVQVGTGIVRFTPVSAAPNYVSGYGFLYLNDSGGKGQLKFKWRSSDGLRYGDVNIVEVG